ncbi:RNA polymerase sigma-70 factor [Bacteroidaceae bacterium HV4-6-C5C]|jgi:RNA polymerase sigma-70 factor (ECF subfamily)|nr:RNA polymerase sigma-70 factor [Bacteroidaceae bacterium HV4-6-C5C]
MTSVEKSTLKALKKGQIKEFEKIYRLYNGWVYHFICAIIKNSNIAKDLTQDVFLLIWDKRENINCDENFEGYLFKISKNMVYHYIKRELLLQNYLGKREEIEDGNISYIENDLDTKFFEDYIMKLINELPEARRRIFILYWKADMSYREIATRLSISEKTVSTQVQRSIHFLRARMGKIAFIGCWALLYSCC